MANTGIEAESPEAPETETGDDKGTRRGDEEIEQTEEMLTLEQITGKDIGLQIITKRKKKDRQRKH